MFLRLNFRAISAVKSPKGRSGQHVNGVRDGPPRDEAVEERIAGLTLAHYGHRPGVVEYHSENS